MNAKYLIEEKINKTIIARNNEIESIKKHFDRVLEGRNGVSVIMGLPGIGKTFLVEHVVTELASSNVTYVYGKFRQHDNKPFIAISEVIEQMVKHLLTLPYEQLENIKNVLEKVLGSDVEIITSISPYARKLLGYHKIINIDNYEKLKYRVRKALFQFLSTVSEALFPLIMFIDDLQWADTPSLEVIERICKDNELLNLLFIVAYRDNEEKSIKKVENLTKISQIKNDYIPIQLHELTDFDIKGYIQLIFGVNTENIDYLARIIYGLTLGNPFYIKEILHIFMKEDILVYSAQRKLWVVKIDGINNLSLSTDIEQIIINKINKLSDEDKSLLELISCLDGKVEYKLLKKIINIEDALLSNQLNRLCEAAFLVKTVEDYQADETLSYGFVHDIILELVYKKIDSEKRAKIHYKIAKNLTDNADKTFIENNSLFIASQLLRCDYHMMTQENTERWIFELYNAGMEAKQSAAIEQALKIFQCCVGLIPYTDSKDKYDLEMKINIELGECEYICERYQEAKERFEVLITKYNTPENLITIKRKYMNLYSYTGDSEKVIELGIEVLNQLNFKFNTKHLVIDLIKGKLLFSNKKIEKIKNAPMIKDERLMIILETLMKMIPAANIINDKIFGLTLMKIGILSAKHGNSPYSPIGYTAYSYIMYNIWKDHEKGKKLKDITIDLLKETDNLSSKSIEYSFIGTFIDHWSNPMEKSMEYLESSIEEGTKIGEYIYSGYAIVSIIYAKYIMGIPLKEITNYTNLQAKKLQRIGEDIATFIDKLFNPHVHYLEEGILTKEDYKNEEEVKTLSNNKSLSYYAFMLQRFYLEGEKEKAYELVENITPSIGLLKGHIMYTDLLFYSILTRLDRQKALQNSEKRKNKRLIKKNMKELKYWINIYKENHYARYLLAKAEYVKLFEKEKSLEKLYNEAISFAENRGQLQLEAIGNLLAAKYYDYNIKLSKFYAKEAVSLFKKWGAIYIVNLIKKEFGLEKETKLHTEEKQLHMKKTEKIEANEEINKSILYHLNVIENMEEEEGFIYMLDFLTRNNYADYGAVLFEKADEIHLQYEKKKNEKVTYYKELINIKYVGNLPRKVLRYVARTGEEVILNKNSNGGIFANDPYIVDKDEVSIVCIPIKYLGVFVGIIYLEKICEGGFNENFAQIIRSLIPSLISKRSTIKDVNLHRLFNPQRAESPLTDREVEVLQKVAEGMSNSSISKQLYISIGTVKSHLSNIYSKLEVDSRIKAVVKAKELNLIKIV
ncbi:AAA family ATPase [Oceanirhabdus seepicola]|uniref:AAA family ATPase n=1 Tax=Oceanirhabdus seepicola TaxID=2828781 RepID=A0A9J6NY08_9CLOT|nr:AAA family ATPase [Oceanirhabdus seepicola]MCM1988870.1 AAA family ATPase [Oceanirhabdus seepicola]